MNRKNFKTSFDDILSGEINPNKKSHDGIRKPEPLSYSETKATFVVREDHLDKLRAIAFMERKMIKSILSDALSVFFENYQKANGDIILPKK